MEPAAALSRGGSNGLPELIGRAAPLARRAWQRSQSAAAPALRCLERAGHAALAPDPLTLAALSVVASRSRMVGTSGIAIS